MKITTAFSATIIALSLTAGAASAQTVTQGEWLEIGELSAKLEAVGYQVREIERDDDRYEVELVDSDGVKFESKVDRTTGEILHKERDDD